MQTVINACIDGSLNHAQIAAFLALMRSKEETVEELTAAALIVLSHARKIDLGPHLLDIVGTGGDGGSTFNVSTLTSVVVASAGVKVAKHGNRAVSSKSGSSDLLTTAGFNLKCSDDVLRQSIETTHLAFLFAPYFHQALQNVGEVRKSLGIRTLFNLIGPLVNPARVDHIVLGVYDKKWLKPMAEVLANLGLKKAYVIHSEDGLDEVSIAAPTHMVIYADGHFKQWTINPHDYNLGHPDLSGVIIQTPVQSLELGMRVLNKDKGPHRDMILLNAALALLCINKVESLVEGIAMAQDAIDSGLALKTFEMTKHIMNQENLAHDKYS